MPRARARDYRHAMTEAELDVDRLSWSRRPFGIKDPSSHRPAASRARQVCHELHRGALSVAARYEHLVDKAR